MQTCRTALTLSTLNEYELGNALRFAISSGLGKDQIYTVKVKAEVEKGAPGAKNTLALHQIVLLKGSPRVSINVQEQIDGAPALTKYVQGIMEQTARELQFNLIDVGTASGQESKMAARDAVLGNDKNAAKLEDRKRGYLGVAGFFSGNRPRAGEGSDSHPCR
jgi:hypothetical protein